MLAQQSDDALAVCALDDAYRVRPGTEVRFPAPWPRRRASWDLAPDAGLAVFAGVHALQAVGPSGAVRWEVRHGCWEHTCAQMHQSCDEYADRADHRYPRHGSVGFSADGRLVWAHVRSPLAEGELDRHVVEEWLVLDAADGRVLARANADTVSEGSFHVPHPVDPGQMGLSIGEGQDGSPVRWGHWDGQQLAVDYVDDDVVVLSMSPSGRYLMTVSHDQAVLAVRRTYGVPGPGIVELGCESGIPRHPGTGPGDDEPGHHWEWAGGFLDETTVIGATEESSSERGTGRHWLIDVQGARPVTWAAYPFAVSCRPAALGDGAWSTLSESGDALQVWALETMPG
jgi:hypothetical protein